MSMTLTARAALTALALLASPSSGPGSAAPSYEAVRQEQACPRDREPRSLRQTIVILDEAIVAAKAADNQVWKRIVVEAADAREVSLGALGTRERLSLFVARRDGSELVPLFLGCSPNLPAEEVERARAEDSPMDRFFGRDSGARRQSARDAFAGGIAQALAQVQKRAESLAAAPAPAGGFLRALQNAGRLANPNHGLPRFILVSPFRVIDRAQITEVAAARERGFALAAQSGIDFGRAEVYLAGAALGDGPSLDFARALILGSKGVLVAARSDGLPRLQAEPVALRVFAGFIDYGETRPPLQVRLAATAQGDLVNSWVETTLARATATPIAGKMLCREESCEIRGEEGFALAWFPDLQRLPNQAERAHLPFGGARFVEMTTQARSVSGRISDPLVVFGGQDAKRRDELRFDIRQVEGGQF